MAYGSRHVPPDDVVMLRVLQVLRMLWFVPGVGGQEGRVLLVGV
jgi:hypothetical protein